MTVVVSVQGVVTTTTAEVLQLLVRDLHSPVPR